MYPEIVDFDGEKEVNNDKISFKKFVYQRGPSFVTNLYTNHLQSPSGIFPYVDYIGRSENLKQDLIEALEMAGEDFDRQVIENMPPVRQGASLEEAKGLIDCDEDVLNLIKTGELGENFDFHKINSHAQLDVLESYLKNQEVMLSIETGRSIVLSSGSTSYPNGIVRAIRGMGIHSFSLFRSVGCGSFHLPNALLRISPLLHSLVALTLHHL